jgi:hypothetical protein
MRTAEVVSQMISPYLRIKDVRRAVQISQTLLLESLPPRVVSHMFERHTMGMVPVVLNRDHLHFPKSDDSEGDEAAAQQGRSS